MFDFEVPIITNFYVSFAGNALLSGWCAAIAALAAWARFGGIPNLVNPAAQRLCEGVMVSAGLTVAFRSYWNAALIAGEDGVAFALWAIENEWVGVTLVTGILAGNVYAVSGILDRAFERWKWVAAITAWVTTWSAVQVALLVAHRGVSW